MSEHGERLTESELLRRQLDYLFRDVAIARAVWIAHPEADMGEALDAVLEMADQRARALSSGSEPEGDGRKSTTKKI